VVLTLHPEPATTPEDELKLVWLDRPSGLVRDAREPEASFAAWASAAEALLPKSPEQAAARALMVERSYAALCREAGAPALFISDNPGLPCGRSKSRDQAELVSLQAHAKLGHVREAFEAYRNLRARNPSVLEQRSAEKVASLLSSLPATSGISLRRGPSVELQSSPSVHLPAARFVSEMSLYLQRRVEARGSAREQSEAVLYDLSSSQESAVPMPTDAIMRDPSGQLAVTGIERGCRGYTLRIERAPSLGTPYLAAPALSTPVLLPEVSTPDCARSPTTHRSSGFVVLGWAPQGVVVARGSQVHVVPLGLDGKATAEPRALDAGTPCPAPLPSGAANPDGTVHVEVTPYGILVFGPPATPLELWRPEGYLAIGKAAKEAAVSPSGRRIAVSTEGGVYLLEKP
jgi:hypothetical protein